jgi:uncharacterized protein Yka (UPF0111/DUF47 family)
MGLFDAGMKESNKFFTMLVENARMALEAITYLAGAVEEPGPPTIEHLRALSQASIESRRVLIDELHETFVTPLDREDIYNLSQAFEKMVTYALTTVEEMHLLHVSADEPIRRMVVLAREQAEHLMQAVQRLAKNPRVAGDHANRVHDQEREVERVYRDAIHDLFAQATELAALPGVFYRREVYRHLSNMADRAVSAGDVLGMIVMKIA